MKAAVISLGSQSSQWTIEEMKKYFDQVDDIKITQVEVTLGSSGLDLLYQGNEFPQYDCVYVKGSFRYANLARAISSILMKGGVYLPIQPWTFSTGHDKLLTHLELQVHKIPMPVTYITAKAETAKDLLKEVNYPIVMKFPQGTHGKGVMFADSYASATSVLDALQALNQPFLIQEFIESAGEDIRAIVVGDKVVAAMKRKSSSDDKRANIHAGGSAEACELDYHTKKIAVEAAHAVGLQIGAVDIVEGPKGPLVIEVNVSPGLQGITKSTGINVAAKIAKFLADKTKEVKAVKTEKKASKVLKDAGIPQVGTEIITSLDFRGKRILLPEAITAATRFSEKKDVSIKATAGKLEISKFE